VEVTQLTVLECRRTTLDSVDLDMLTPSNGWWVEKLRNAHENGSLPSPLILWNHEVTRAINTLTNPMNMAHSGATVTGLHFPEWVKWGEGAIIDDGMDSAIMSAMPVSGGPYLQAAAFCDKVLQEKDGVLSLIRLVDRWNIVGQSETMLPTAIQTNIVLMFKSGMFRGPAQVAITPISPSGERTQSVKIPVFFEGDDDRGANLVLPMGFPLQEPGLYWFEVSVNGQIMTAMPLHVVYLQQIAPAGPSLPQSPQ
jgi:hypothetical protein